MQKNSAHKNNCAGRTSLKSPKNMYQIIAGRISERSPGNISEALKNFSKKNLVEIFQEIPGGIFEGIFEEFLEESPYELLKKIWKDF